MLTTTHTNGTSWQGESALTPVYSFAKGIERQGQTIKPLLDNPRGSLS